MAESTDTFELRWPWSAPATFVGLTWIVYAWSIWVAGGLDPASRGMWIGSLTGIGYWIAGGVDSVTIVHDREWERCVSGIFLHVGFLHVIMNSAAILQMGRILEMLTTRGRCWFVLLFSGLCGSLAIVVWAQVTGTPLRAVGASGAGCGVGAALVVLSQGVDALTEFRKQMITWVVVILAMGFMPQISGTGHAGGLIGGAIAGLVIRRRGFVRMANDSFSSGLAGATKLLTLVFVAALAFNAWRANDRKAELAMLDEAANEVYGWLNAGEIPQTAEWRMHLEKLDLPGRLEVERGALLDLVRQLQRIDGGRVSADTAEDARAALMMIRQR